MKILGKTILLVEFKNVYGVERIYPICDNAKLFASIAGTKTLSEENLRAAQKLGFRIEQKWQQQEWITEVFPEVYQ